MPRPIKTICFKCNERPRAAPGMSYCQECFNEYSRARWKASEKPREGMRKGHLMRTYGITLEEYNARFDAQNGLCAMCGNAERLKMPSGVVHSLAVDHCHDTGKIRGLLCAACNTAIGQLNHDIELLEKGIEYLKRTN